MPNVIYPSAHALIDAYGSEVLAVGLNAGFSPLFDIHGPVGAEVKGAYDFERRVLGRLGVEINSSRIKSYAGLYPRFLALVDHLKEVVHYREIASHTEGNFICTNCLGPVGIPAVEYTDYLATGALIVDLLARKAGTSMFVLLGRCTARSGRDAQALIAEAMVSKVTVDHATWNKLAPVAERNGREVPSQDSRLGKIVLRVCGSTTTWLRKENSNVWTGKGAIIDAQGKGERK